MIVVDHIEIPHFYVLVNLRIVDVLFAVELFLHLNQICLRLSQFVQIIELDVAAAHLFRKLVMHKVLAVKLFNRN